MEEFSNNKLAKDGKSGHCKACQKVWRDANREVLAANNKAWRLANLDAINQQRRDEYAQNPEVILARNRAYYAENSEQIRAQKKIYNAEHFEERKARDKAYRKANPGRRRNNDLLSKYGITLEEFDDMVIAQGGVCAIDGCETPHTEKRSLAVDHDHACCPGSDSCGACVRGLICTNCNTALGMVGDSPRRLLGLVQYLAEAS